MSVFVQVERALQTPGLQKIRERNITMCRIVCLTNSAYIEETVQYGSPCEVLMQPDNLTGSRHCVSGHDHGIWFGNIRGK
jgi:hypothetical protein